MVRPLEGPTGPGGRRPAGRRSAPRGRGESRAAFLVIRDWVPGCLSAWIRGPVSGRGWWCRRSLRLDCWRGAFLRVRLRWFGRHTFALTVPPSNVKAVRSSNSQVVRVSNGGLFGPGTRRNARERGGTQAPLGWRPARLGSLLLTVLVVAAFAWAGRGVLRLGCPRSSRQCRDAAGAH